MRWSSRAAPTGVGSARGCERLAAATPGGRTMSESRRTAWVVGTFDTKGDELHYLCERIRAQGVAVISVDVSTSGRDDGRAQIAAREVASHHPDGADAVFTGERGSAVSA